MSRKYLKSLIKFKIKVGVVAAALAIVLGIGMVAPDVHKAYIRDHVGSRVVKITNEAENSGGTGFVMKMPSGKTLVITNAHVCNIPGKLYSKLPGGSRVQYRIVKQSNTTDLCALSGITGVEGLDLASSVSIGETVGLIGHPKLMPLTFTLGELIGYETVTVLISQRPCVKDAGMYQTIDTLFGPICVEVVKDAGLTTLPSRPGSSGSPVVNFYGNVVGVLFAGDELGWGILVSLKDLRKFIRNL